MAGRTVYTVSQLTAILGMSEPDIQQLVESRQIIGEFNQALMAYTITQENLLDFMKSRKMFEKMHKIVSNRVVICDRDQKMIFLVKAELERTGKIQVKVATTGKEVEMALTDYLPDVLAMPMAAVQRATDNLAGVIRKARDTRPVQLIIYHPQPEVVMNEREDTKRMVEFLKIDHLISIAPGTRPLVAAIEQALGLRNPTRRLTAFSAPAAPSPSPSTSRYGPSPLDPAPPSGNPPTRRMPATRIEPLAPPPAAAPASPGINPNTRRMTVPLKIQPLAPPPEDPKTVPPPPPPPPKPPLVNPPPP